MRMKQLFSLLLCLALVLLMLPTAVFAAKEATQVDKNQYKGITVEGTPYSSLPVGYYTAEVEYNTSTYKNQWALKITGPSNSPLYQNQPVAAFATDSSSISTCSWMGLTFTSVGRLTSDSEAAFEVTNEGEGSTVISSNNIKMLKISRSGTIKRNTTFDVTFRATDYNIAALDVDPSSLAFTSYNSNDSFVLTNTSVKPVFVDPAESGTDRMTFDIQLSLRYTGSGNILSFTCYYKLTDGTVRTVDCTTNIPRTEEYVDDKDDDDDDDKTELDPLTPYIIVDSYDYGGSSVTAGEDFTLTLRLRNTSTTNALLNIVMNVSPTGVFSMTSSSNTFFIERLSAGSIMEKKVTIKPGLTKVTDDEDANAINLSFKYQYVNNANDNERLVSGESSESITLPIDFPDRFEMGIPQVEEAYQGEDCYISVSLVNKGRSGVYNLTARVEGEGMANPGQSQYVGNLNAGTESTADFSVRYNEPGDFIGNIVVTYEDANMNPKEASAPFNISVMAADFGGDDILPPEELPPTEPVDTEPEKDPIRPVIYTVGAIVCLMSAYVTVQKAKLKRSLFSDDDI